MRDWDEFDRFEDVINKYMPRMGEGETMASQICTAVNKLVYKWYNDGDVFDNTHGLNGWANDLSSYANWLYNHVCSSNEILDMIVDCDTEDEYSDLLYKLAEACLDERKLEEWNEHEKVGSIYTEKGIFRWIDLEEYEDDKEDWYDDDEYDEYE